MATIPMLGHSTPWSRDHYPVHSLTRHDLGSQVLAITPTMISAVLPYYWCGCGAHGNSPITRQLFDRRTHAEYAGEIWADPEAANLALAAAAPLQISRRFVTPFPRAAADYIVHDLKLGSFTWAPTTTGMLIFPQFPHVMASGDWIPIEFPNDVVAPLLSDDGRDLLGVG